MKIPWPRFLSTPVLRGTIGGIVFFASGKYRKNVGYGGLFESLRSPSPKSIAHVPIWGLLIDRYCHCPMKQQGPDGPLFFSSSYRLTGPGMDRNPFLLSNCHGSLHGCRTLIHRRKQWFKSRSIAQRSASSRLANNLTSPGFNGLALMC
jgi:hypothetical protein